jgi:hypothetical protein
MRPYVVRTESGGRYFFGAGTAGQTSVTGLTEVQASTPFRITTFSLTNQKAHWVYPPAWGTIGVTMSSFLVELMTPRSVEISGVTYTWVETVDLMTWTDLQFVVGAP